jgi:NAD(P)-dependent dehydrogenase (short-subunit alcohol dehydrogenase family)
MRGLDNRVALVTGGAAGMGLASAKALAAEGASVIVADINAEAADRAARSITESGGIATAYQVDVSSLSSLRALFTFVETTFGRLHVFFSNAGIGGAQGFDVTEKQFDEVFDTNLKSHFFATNLAVPLMRNCAPHASIIYMSSIRGLQSRGQTPLYSISKAGIIMMARLFARNLGPEGIRANTICPGGVETAFPRDWLGLSQEEYKLVLEKSASDIPLRRVAQPGDIASLVTFLASDQSAYLTGLAIPVDGGTMS